MMASEWFSFSQSASLRLPSLITTKSGLGALSDVVGNVLGVAVAGEVDNGNVGHVLFLLIEAWVERGHYRVYT